MMRQPSTLTKKEYETYSEEEKNNQLIVKKKVSPAEYTLDPKIDLKVGSTKQTWLELAKQLADKDGVKLDQVVIYRILQGAFDGPNSDKVARFFIANRTDETIYMTGFKVTHGDTYEPNYPCNPLYPGYSISATFHNSSSLQDTLLRVELYFQCNTGSFTLTTEHAGLLGIYANEMYADCDRNKFKILGSIDQNRHCIVTYCIYKV